MRILAHILFIAVVAIAFAAPATADVTPCRDPEAKLPPPPHARDAGDRQGGDSLFDPLPIPSLPFTDTGTTCGYADDYAAACVGDGAPDVVYSYVPAVTSPVSVNLCGSSYDTGLYIYDATFDLVACNDDGYGCGAASRLDNVELRRGETYYIVVDGYGDDCGAYAFDMHVYEPCHLICPPGSALEGEPPIVPNYNDVYNDGCCGGDGELFMSLWGRENGQRNFCGRSGWYLSCGSNYRETDWFIATFGPTGVIEVRGDAEFPTYFFELGPQDCASVGVVQMIIIGPCTEDVMTVTGQPGSTVWLWAGPTVFAAPDGSDLLEYSYVLRMSGLASETVTAIDDGPLVEPSTWSNVKSLYR